MSKPRKSRAEKAKETREALLNAAAKVVGIHGYNQTSISRITEEAGIAQGTFYLYFDSRQALFDELLPYIGTRALSHLRQDIEKIPDFFKREEIAFRSFFNYILDHPYYYRVLGEAETAAPSAFEKWFEFITGRYLRLLERALEAGEISGLTQQELNFMAVILLGCRRYAYQQFMKSAAGPKPMPEWVVDAYMKLIRRSLRACPDEASLAAPKPPQRKRKSRASPA